MEIIQRTFKVHVDAILSAPRLALADDDGGHDLLPEVGLALLDGGHDHVPDAGRGQAVEASLDPLDGNDVEILRPRVVRTVHRRRHRQTQRHPELVTRRSSAPYKSHRRSLNNLRSIDRSIDMEMGGLPRFDILEELEQRGDATTGFGNGRCFSGALYGVVRKESV